MPSNNCKKIVKYGILNARSRIYFKYNEYEYKISIDGPRYTGHKFKSIFNPSNNILIVIIYSYDNLKYEIRRHEFLIIFENKFECIHQQISDKTEIVKKWDKDGYLIFQKSKLVKKGIVYRNNCRSTTKDIKEFFITFGGNKFYGRNYILENNLDKLISTAKMYDEEGKDVEITKICKLNKYQGYKPEKWKILNQKGKIIREWDENGKKIKINSKISINKEITVSEAEVQISKQNENLILKSIKKKILTNRFPSLASLSDEELDSLIILQEKGLSFRKFLYIKKLIPHTSDNIKKPFMKKDKYGNCIKILHRIEPPKSNHVSNYLFNNSIRDYIYFPDNFDLINDRIKRKVEMDKFSTNLHSNYVKLKKITLKKLLSDEKMYLLVEIIQNGQKYEIPKIFVDFGVINEDLSKLTKKQSRILDLRYEYIIQKIIRKNLIYNGQTINPPSVRFKHHITHSDSYIDRAIHEKNKEDFIYSIDFVLINQPQFIADWFERICIKFYKSRNKSIGYNIHEGGLAGSKNFGKKGILDEKGCYSFDEILKDRCIRFSYKGYITAVSYGGSNLIGHKANINIDSYSNILTMKIYNKNSDQIKRIYIYKLDKNNGYNPRFLKELNSSGNIVMQRNLDGNLIMQKGEFRNLNGINAYFYYNLNLGSKYGSLRINKSKRKDPLGKGINYELNVDWKKGNINLKVYSRDFIDLIYSEELIIDSISFSVHRKQD